MSKRHQASRRRTYGRRQHEIRERRERAWPPDEVRRDRLDDGATRRDAPAAELQAMPLGATWLGLE